MTVYANGLEVACKAQSNKVIAAFPDVCFTPPENPATPPGVPVPYPSFGFDSDTDKGTSTVKIGGKTITQKNKSYYTKTTGTEAGCAAKKGIITSKNTGKEYAQAWSNDVKADGEPVNRFTDISTNNHASSVANTPPWLKVAKANKGWTSTCDKLYRERISTYDPNDCDTPDYQSHHIIDNASFTRSGARDNKMSSYEGAAKLGERAWKVLKNLFQSRSAHPGKNYHEGDPPCICLEDGQVDGMEHKKAHDKSRDLAKANAKAQASGKWSYKEARAAGIQSVKEAANLTEKEAKCIGYMLDAYYKNQLGCTNTTEVRAPGTQPSASTQFATGHGQTSTISARPA
jgi:hypothetical protein